MKKIANDAVGCPGKAARRKTKEATIDLMPYFTVHIARLLDTYGHSANEHYVRVPTRLLNDATELICTLNYPIEEPHTFKIPIRKFNYRDITFIDMAKLFMAVAKEYEVLSKTKGLIDCTLSELWIKGMKIKGNELIVLIGS